MSTGQMSLSMFAGHAHMSHRGPSLQLDFQRQGAGFPHLLPGGWGGRSKERGQPGVRNVESENRGCRCFSQEQGDPGRRCFSHCFRALGVPESVEGWQLRSATQVFQGLEPTCILAAKALLAEGLGTRRSCPFLPLPCDVLPPPALTSPSWGY